MWNESACLATNQVEKGECPFPTSDLAQTNPHRREGLSPFSTSAGSASEDRARIHAQTDAIHRLIRGDVDARFEIGQRLIALRGLLGRFEFQPLIKAQYGWSKANTCNHMNVARVFSGLETECRVRICWAALVILARDVDPRARSEAVAMARSREFVTKKIAQTLVGKYREPPPASHDQLLVSLCELAEDFLGLLAQATAVRAELTAEQHEFLSEIVAEVRRGVRSELTAPDSQASLVTALEDDNSTASQFDTAVDTTPATFAVGILAKPSVDPLPLPTLTIPITMSRRSTTTARRPGRASC